MAKDGWSPADYGRFKDARRQPFLDLLALVKPVHAPRVLDVGCGTGELTAHAHEVLGAVATVGVDSSPAMLAKATPRRGVSFVAGELGPSLPRGPFDVVLSNSALNWVADHERVFRLFHQRLAEGGQVAVQLPSNGDAPFGRCCEAVARAEPFATELAGWVYLSPAQRCDRYAELLERVGFAEQRVGEWLYPQKHESPRGLVDFARGGLLSPYRERLAPARFEAFVEAYEAALVRELGPGPVFFPFRRLFVWARRSALPRPAATPGSGPG